MTELLLHRKKLCLDQAQEFIEATEVLDVQKYPHIIYHLCLLALEEVGKASILSAQALRHEALDHEKLDKWLDHHRKKLQWAIWSPLDRIDPKDFEDARQWAQDAHQRRLASLYVDHNAEISDSPPRENVPPDLAERIRNIANTRLEYERARGTPTGEVDDLTEWFVTSMDDPTTAKQLLSGPFREQYVKLEGDARKWAAWAREEISRQDKELREQFAADLAKPAAPRGSARPKWQASAVLHTPSHNLRPKPLAYWNEHFNATQLIWMDKKDSLTLRITLNDNEKLEALPARLLSLTTMVVAILNIATTGYFWYERPGFERKKFKEIRDLENKKAMSIEGRKSFWGDDSRTVLTNEHIDHARNCMLAYTLLPSEEAEPIFSPYCNGLALIAKSDVFYDFDEIGRKSFCGCLAGAMKKYGGWNGKLEDYDACLHEGFTPFIPEREHREQMFQALKNRGDPVDSSLENLRTAKHLCDLFLIFTAKRTLKQSVEHINVMAESLKAEDKNKT